MRTAFATLRQTLCALRLALAIFRQRRRLWAASEEGTDVPVWHAQERRWQVPDGTWSDPEGFIFRASDEDEWQTADLGWQASNPEWPEGDYYPISWRWETVPGAVFLTRPEADAWIDSQRHSHPDGLRRHCASCRPGSLRAFLEVAQ